MYMYIYIHICMYIYIHKYIYIHTYKHIYTHTYIYIHICIYAYRCIHMYTYSCTHIYICILIHKHKYMRKCIHIYIYINIHTSNIPMTRKPRSEKRLKRKEKMSDAHPAPCTSTIAGPSPFDTPRSRTPSDATTV